MIKEVKRFGNGAMILLPKEWEGAKVEVVKALKSKEEILEDVLEVLKPHLAKVQGIYLVGSYARGEQTLDSDVDILVLANEIFKPEKLGYSFIVVKEEHLSINGFHRILFLQQIKEAYPLLNRKLLYELKNNKISKQDIVDYLELASSSISIAKSFVKLAEEKGWTKELVQTLTYSLVLHIRGLLIIQSLVRGKKYSNKVLVRCLGELSNLALELYKSAKNKKPAIEINEPAIYIEKLIRIAEREYKNVKS